MPSNATSNSSTAIDFRAAQCIALFGGQQVGVLTRVMELRQQSGRDPSYALVTIPMDAMDRVAPTICGVAGSVVGNVKHCGQLVQCMATLLGADGSSTAQTTIMNGRVVDIDQNIYPDKAVIRVHDDRHLLEGVRLVGSLWLSGTPGSGQPLLRAGWPLHVNPGGRPNCIWVSAGGGLVPVECHPFLGLGDAEEPPDAATQPTTKACYWTPVALMAYLRYAVVFGALSDLPWFSFLPTSVTWPLGLESAMVDETGGATRKAKEMTLEGNLLDAVTNVLESAGPFALWLSPNEDGTSTMAIVRTKYNGGNSSGAQGVSIPRAAGGKAQETLATPGIVVAGSIRENSQNFYSRVAVAGGLSTVETRLTYSGDPTDVNSQLVPGWDDSDLNGTNGMKQYILNLINTKDPPTSLDDAIKSAFRTYWRVMRCWVINPTLDFQAGTDQDGFPLCKTTRNPKPHLDSSYVNADATAVKSSQLAALNTKREIPLEVDPTYYASGDKPDDKNFGPLPISNGVQIATDGSIDLSALAEQFQDGRNLNGLFTIQPVQVTDGVYNFADPSSFVIGRIRLTISIPTDFRLTGAAKLANDPTQTTTYTATVDDSDRIDFTQTRLAYVNALGLLQKEQRHGSWPIPESVLGSKMADDGFIRNDTDEANNQAARKLRDLGRLDRTTMLVSNKIALTYQPGQMIDSLTNVGGAGGSYPLKTCLKAVHYHFEERPQRLVYHGI